MTIKKIPMSTQEIMELFENPNQKFDIDFANSVLKGEAFITYIANMKIECSLLESEAITAEEKRELLKHFLNFKYVVGCDTLLFALADALMLVANPETQFKFSNWISTEELLPFVEENKETLSRVQEFLNSMLVTVPSFDKEFKEKVFLPAIENKEIEVIDDLDYIPLNAFGLISIPSFLDLFLGTSTQNSELKYFKAQVENMLFKKKTLFELILGLKGDCFLISCYNIFSSEKEEETSYFKKETA